MEGVTREERDAYLTHQLKSAGVTQAPFDDNSRQALYQVTRGILGKVNRLALTALRLGSERKASVVDEAILLDARRQGAAMSAPTKKAPETTVLSIGATVRTAAGHATCELDQTGLAATARHSLCGPRTDDGQESVGRQSRATAGCPQGARGHRRPRSAPRAHVSVRVAHPHSLWSV